MSDGVLLEPEAAPVPALPLGDVPVALDPESDDAGALLDAGGTDGLTLDDPDDDPDGGGLPAPDGVSGERRSHAVSAQHSAAAATIHCEGRSICMVHLE